MIDPQSRPEMVWLARICFAALIALQIVWHAVVEPAPPIVTLLATLPLAIGLRPVLADPPRGRFIGALLVLPWFVHGVTVLLISEQRWLAGIEVGLILTYIAAQKLERQPEPAKTEG